MDSRFVRTELTVRSIEEIVEYGSQRGFNGSSCPKAWFQFLKTFGFTAEHIKDKLQQYLYYQRDDMGKILQGIAQLANEELGKTK